MCNNDDWLNNTRSYNRKAKDRYVNLQLYEHAFLLKVTSVYSDDYADAFFTLTTVFFCSPTDGTDAKTGDAFSINMMRFEDPANVRLYAI